MGFQSIPLLSMAIESPLLCYCILQLEEQWKRRESWSIEHHEHQKKLRELQTQEFQQHVDERNAKVARQRRWSQGNRYHLYCHIIVICFMVALNCSFWKSSKDHLLLIQCYYRQKPKLN